MLHNLPANLENSAVATELEKVSFHSNPKERQCQRMLKLPHSCTHLTTYQSNAQNSPKPGFNNTWTVSFQMFKLDLEKAEEPEIKLPPVGKSKRVPEKHRLLFYWLCQSLWLCRSQQTGKFFKRWKYQTTWPASWEVCMQVKKQQLELDVEQWTGSKLGKEYIKSGYFTLLI